MLVIGDLYMSNRSIYGGLESQALNHKTNISRMEQAREIKTISVKPHSDIVLSLGAYVHDDIATYKRHQFYHFRYKACVWLWDEDMVYLLPIEKFLR